MTRFGSPLVVLVAVVLAGSFIPAAVPAGVGSATRPASAGLVAQPVGCAVVEEGPVTVVRYGGADRYETAVCVSFGTWPAHDDPGVGPQGRAGGVVLARGDLFPDALAGGPLAAQVGGPLLLTRPTVLLPEVKAEVGRVLAPGETVFLLGGPGALSEDVRAGLEADGYVVSRLAGADRFATAVAIAEALPDTSNFFFATGMDFPDALAAGSAAAALTVQAEADADPGTRPFALLLTNNDVMPAATADFATGRRDLFGTWTLHTTGVPADQAAAAAFGADSLTHRFTGANRFDTAAQIAETIYTTSGGALAGHAGEVTGPFLDVFGGDTVIAENTKNTARTAFTP